MKKEMRLQGIGMVEGTPAGELKIGDITRWNNGGIERITSVEFSKTGKTVVVGIEYMSYSEVPQGKIVSSTRTFRVSRLVNVIGGGNTVLVSDTRFEMVDVATREQEFEAERARQQAEEVKVEQIHDTFLVEVPHGSYAFIIGRSFQIGYKDKHGEYNFDKLTFKGFLNATDSLLFDDEEGNTLHLNPLGINYVWIKLEEKQEEPKEEVIEYRSMSWNLEYYSTFRVITVIDGNEFGYFVRKTEWGDMEYRVMVTNDTASDLISHQQVLAYENDLEGLERCINNFLSKGFNFNFWTMEPQNVRVKVIDASKPHTEEEKAVKEQNEVDLFKRYHELLMASLQRSVVLTKEERIEMADLQEELNLKDRTRLYQLHKAAFGKESVQQ